MSWWSSGFGRGILFFVVLAVCVLGVIESTGAIDKADQLPHGQFLVDEATAEIDRQVMALMKRGFGREEVYRGVSDILDWVIEYDQTAVAGAFPLTDPRGLLVTDGIADTLATRLHGVLKEYTIAHPEEILTEGRQALEILLAAVPLPPGRFLGFHFQHMGDLYRLRADTLLSMPALNDRAGVQDGFLRHLWDLNQVYEQVHRDAGERYMCRISQEDWILQRMVCEKCGNRGYRYRNQRMGMSQEDSEECNKILLDRSNDTESIERRIDCYHWGHVFTVMFSQCSDSLIYSVPLPNYKVMQKEVATGIPTFPDAEELMKDY